MKTPAKSRRRLALAFALVAAVAALFGAPTLDDGRLVAGSVGWVRRAWVAAFGAEMDIALHHALPEARTRWRVPEAYLATDYDYRQRPTALIAIEAALPDMDPWWTSGLRSDTADLARKVSIAIEAGEDFTREKRNLARLREIDFDFIGEVGDLLKYRAVARGDSARAATSTFFLVPRQQVPGRAVYFLCEQRCTAYADFSKTVTLEIRFPPERLGDWATIERKVRGLVDSFARP